MGVEDSPRTAFSTEQPRVSLIPIAWVLGYGRPSRCPSFYAVAEDRAQRDAP